MFVKSVGMTRKYILGFIILWEVCQCASESYQHKSGVNESIRIFSPRMDYEEWRPLGQGDPLKNDPTFDYVPPVLDPVQYWLDDTQTTEPSSKRDVLVLGVTAKKTSPQIPDHFLKFMDSQKYQDSQQPKNYVTRYFTGSTGAEPPKLIRNTKFRSGPSLDSKHSNRDHYIPYIKTNEFYHSEKQKPYTMMLPPPLNSVPNNLQFGMPQNSPQKPNYIPPDPPTTSSSVSFEKSNLIYHQSSHQALDWPSANPPHHYHSNPPNNPSLINWPKGESDHIEVDHHHHVAASMNHEIIIGPNANIIVDADDKEEIVVGQKSTDLNMSVIMANTSTTPENYQSKDNVTVSVVMPTNYKGDTTKSFSIGTRTNIGVTPASSSSSSSSASSSPASLEMSATTPFVSSTTMLPSSIMDMSWQQDQAPPPMFPVRMPSKIFRRPNIPYRPGFGGPARPMGPMMMYNPDAFRPTTIRSPVETLLQREMSTKGLMMTPTTTTTTTTTMAPSTMPVGDSFTTDPIFSHYKQPAAPLSGPMYLIIQGHSKVKTYKPTVNKHGVPVAIETTIRPISEFEQFVNENTRRVEIKSTTERSQDVKETKVGANSLVNLVEKGVSAFTVSEN